MGNGDSGKADGDAWVRLLADNAFYYNRVRRDPRRLRDDLEELGVIKPSDPLPQLPPQQEFKTIVHEADAGKKASDASFSPGTDPKFKALFAFPFGASQ